MQNTKKYCKILWNAALRSSCELLELSGALRNSRGLPGVFPDGDRDACDGGNDTGDEDESDDDKDNDDDNDDENDDGDNDNDNDDEDDEH